MDDLQFPISNERQSFRSCSSNKDMNSTTTERTALLRVPQTYTEGEDSGRLKTVAQCLGLQQTRKPLKRWPHAMEFLLDPTLAAARMHSVGRLGDNEHLDESGKLHLLTVRRKTISAASSTEFAYGTLHDLFDGLPMEMDDEQESIVSQEENEIVVDSVEGGSLHAAVFGIVKGTVGPAILYLPHGFQQSGYAIAIPSMIFATSMFVYNSYRLLECWKVESDRNKQFASKMKAIRALLMNTDGSSSQDDIVPKLLTYPELAYRALGRYAILVEVGIASMQFGVCLTYLIFVPQNLYECTLAMIGVKVPKVCFLVAMIIIEIPLSWIRDIRKLVPTNVLATLLIVYSVSCILVMAAIFGLEEGTNGQVAFIDNLKALPAWTDIWFLFVGTSFFMMEGSITLLVPLQEAVYRDEDKAMFPSTNQLVTTWILVFYICFSVICCAAFGVGLRTALSASLPNGFWATSVQFAYSLAVIFTFPLQAFPALEVVCHALEAKTRRSPNASSFHRNLLATFLTCLLGVIAVCAINYLGNVVSLLGSLFGIPLALVFPPLLHMKLVKDSSKWTKAMNCIVIVIGFLTMGATSFATIMSWGDGAEGG